MNNKEREIIAHFLVSTEVPWVEKEALLKSLNDDKLREECELYEESAEMIQDMKDLIKNTAVELWKEHTPADKRSAWGGHWFMTKNFKDKPYFKMAIKKLADQFKAEDDMTSFDTLNSIKSGYQSGV